MCAIITSVPFDLSDTGKHQLTTCSLPHVISQTFVKRFLVVATEIVGKALQTPQSDLYHLRCTRQGGSCCAACVVGNRSHNIYGMYLFCWTFTHISSFNSAIVTKNYLGSSQFPLGVHAAACVRVGNALGAGNTTRAIVTCKVALVLSGVKTNIYTCKHKHTWLIHFIAWLLRIPWSNCFICTNITLSKDVNRGSARELMSCLFV